MNISQIRYLASRANNKWLARRSWCMNLAGFLGEDGCHIVSEGFNGNLGDQALAKVMSDTLQRARRKAILIPYGRRELEAYTRNYPLVMAGGEIGDEYHFGSIRRYQPDPSRCSVVGISISNSFVDRPSSSLLDWLRHLRLLTIRDKANCLKARKTLGLVNATWSPDITFSLPRIAKEDQYTDGQDAPNLREKPIVGINISTPFCCFTRYGKFVPDIQAQKNISKVDHAFDARIAMQSYTRAMQTLMRHYVAKDCDVRLFSFSISDTAFALTVLKAASLRLPIIESFWDFPSMVQSISACSVFYASRYHAHIAAILANVPAVSIVMGYKNLGLLEDAGVAGACHYVTRSDMHSEFGFTEKLLDSEPFSLPDAFVDSWRKLALATISQPATF